MEADHQREGVEGVREPRIKLVRGGEERDRGDVEVLDRIFQALPVGLVPHGSGGGAFIGSRGKVDENGDMV